MDTEIGGKGGDMLAEAIYTGNHSGKTYRNWKVFLLLLQIPSVAADAASGLCGVLYQLLFAHVRRDHRL